MRSILYISTLLVSMPNALADNSLNWWQQTGPHWSVTQERNTDMPNNLFQRTKLMAHLAITSGQEKVWFSTSNCRNVSSTPKSISWMVNGEKVELAKYCQNGELQVKPSSDVENEKIIDAFKSNPAVTVSGADNNNVLLNTRQSITFSSNNLKYALNQL